MNVFRRRELYDVVVRHERNSKVTEEELKAWLGGHWEEQTIRGVRELIDRLMWGAIEAAREGGQAEAALNRVDSLLELESWIKAFCEQKAKR